MSFIELPHTHGCLVCGQGKPHGLHLHLFVDPDTSVVRVEFTTQPEHIGFQNIIHGGVLATAIDEAMVWAATWIGKRFRVCGELSVRFRQSAAVCDHLAVIAKVETKRGRLIQTTCEVRSANELSPR